MMNNCKFTFSFLLILCSGIFLTSEAQIKPTNAAERMNGLQKRKLLEDKSPLKDVQFRNIGPTQMNGRVVDVEVNPTDPTEFYLAYASGGLWHTLNNGLSFQPIFEKEDAYSIGDIAVNWSSTVAGERIIWVGTGEVNSSRSSYSGTGVYKTINNGKSWEYLGLPESHHIGKILLHPTNAQVAWVAALGHLYSPNKERGVYKTIDGGKTWKQTLAVDENTGAVEMDINLQNPYELYAATWVRLRRAWDFKEAGAGSGIFKSTDGGNSWKMITSKTSGFPNGEGVGRCGIAVFQKNPAILYAVVDNNFTKPDTAIRKIDTTKYVVEDFKNISKETVELLDNKKLDSFLLTNRFPKKYDARSIKQAIASGKLAAKDLYDWLIQDDGFQNQGIYGCELYKSENGGTSWIKVNEKPLEIYSSYGYYFGKVFVSPVDEKKVILMGINTLLSKDGGKTFINVDKDNTHSDWHACWINPLKDSHWITGNDGGCNITYDNGEKWFMVNSMPVGQFYSVVTDDAKPYNIYGGLQDNGVWMGPSVNGRNNRDKIKQPDPETYEWKQIGGGDGMQVQVDTRDNKTVYYGSQFGFYYRKNVDAARGTLIHPMHDVGEAKLRYNWETPILLSRHNQDIFYYGSNKLHRSLVKAETLEAISGDLTNGKKTGKVPYGTITCVSESPLKFGLLYIGTDDGNIQISKDGGYTWAMITKGLPAGLWISCITPSQHKESRVYASLNGYRYDHFAPYLFVSEDYGITWRKAGIDLPDEPLNVVKEDTKHEEIIYIGSDNGLYASFDMGKTSISMSHQLPRVPVHDLTIQSRENELVIATHGRSIYITKLDTLQQIFKKLLKLEAMKATLKQFDPKQLQAGEPTIDCPPARVKKSKKKKMALIPV